MKMKLFASLFSILCAVVLVSAFASATTIFSDGFEAGSSLGAGWTVTSSSGIATGGQWIVSTTNPSTGLNHIIAQPGAGSTVASTFISRTIRII